MRFPLRRRRFRTGTGLLGAILAEGGEVADIINQLPATERALIAATLDAALQLESSSRRDLFQKTVADYFRSQEGSEDQRRFAVLGYALREALLFFDHDRLSDVERLEWEGRYDAFPGERPEPAATDPWTHAVKLNGEIVQAAGRDAYRCEFFFDSRGVLARPPWIRMSYNQLESVQRVPVTAGGLWYARPGGRVLRGGWVDKHGQPWSFEMSGDHLWEIEALLVEQGVDIANVQ